MDAMGYYYLGILFQIFHEPKELDIRDGPLYQRVSWREIKRCRFRQIETSKMRLF